MLVVVATLVAVLFLLVVALYVGHGVHDTIRLGHNKRQVVTDVRSSLPGAEHRASSLQAEARRASSPSREPAYSWRELSCSIESIDAGWIAQDYVEVCEIRGVDLVPASGPVTGPCRYQAPPRTRSAPLSGDVVLVRGPATALEAPARAGYSCPDGLVRPSVLGVSRVLSGHRPASLAERRAWLVVTTRTPVSRTTLGCDPWAVLFCTSPLEKAILPR